MLITLSALTTLLVINWRLSFDCEFCDENRFNRETFKMREHLKGNECIYEDIQL